MTKLISDKNVTEQKPYMKIKETGDPHSVSLWINELSNGILIGFNSKTGELVINYRGEQIQTGKIFTQRIDND